VETPALFFSFVKKNRRVPDFARVPDAPVACDVLLSARARRGPIV